MSGWRWVFVGLAVVLVGVSCSSAGNADGDGGGAALEGEQVEVAIPWSGTDEERFAAVVARFEERTGATVKLTTTKEDFAAVLNARVAQGDAPDVAVVPGARLLGALAVRDALLPLPEAVAELVDRHYAPVWRELGTANGRLYGVWFKARNQSTLWFDPTVLAGAGVQPPATWDELKAAAATLAGAGIAPFSLGAADGRTVTDWFENVYLRTAGTIAYIDLARHQLAWDDPTVVQALTTLAEVLRPEWLAGGPPGALQTGTGASVSGVFADPPRAGFVLAADPAAVPDTAGVVEFPAIGSSPPSAVVGADAAVLLAGTPGARALVEFLATPEAAEVWARLGGFTSPNRNVDPSTYRTDAERRVAAALTGAREVRYDMSDLQPPPFGADPRQGLWPLFGEYLANPAGAADVAVSMEKIASGIFEP